MANAQIGKQEPERERLLMAPFKVLGSLMPAPSLDLRVIVQVQVLLVVGKNPNTAVFWIDEAKLSIDVYCIILFKNVIVRKI